MKKILCIAASIALPRENVSYEDTWYYMLSEKWKDKYQFIHYFTRALLMSQVKKQYDLYYKYYRPTYVIWQSGLTDCAPRIINERALTWKIIIMIINRLGLTKYFWKVVKFFFKRSPDCVNTKLEQFCTIVEEVTVSFIKEGVEKIIFIKIHKIGESVQKRNPKFLDNINLYNKCFDNLKEKYPNNVILLDPLKDANDSLYVDGYHTNRLGATMVFETIDEMLEGLE